MLTTATAAWLLHPKPRQTGGCSIGMRVTLSLYQRVVGFMASCGDNMTCKDIDRNAARSSIQWKCPMQCMRFYLAARHSCHPLSSLSGATLPHAKQTIVPLPFAPNLLKANDQGNHEQLRPTSTSATS